MNKRYALQKIRKAYREGKLNDDQIRRAEEIGIKLSNNRILQVGVNDLATANPRLASEWDYERNYPLTPKDVVTGSNKRAWWKCAQGHSWETMIVTRTRANSSCPYCANKRTWPGFNDLATTMPDVAAQWHQTKNGELKPEQFTAGSSKKVWWLCPSCGHEWQTTIASRSRNGRNCPKCANKTKKRPGKREVECIELSRVFPSLRAAACEVGNTPNGTCISIACKNPKRTAYGYHWRYIDQKETKR